MTHEATTTPEAVDDVTNRPIAAAMVLLAEAEVVAGAIRAQADHYARQREAEADLLVQKARRVLVAAETKAEVIVSTARATAASPSAVTLDLDALAVDHPQGSDPSDDPAESELDRLLEAAIGRAVNTALLPDTTVLDTTA